MDEVLSAVDKIVERVLLVHEFAVIVPLLTHVITAANVSEHENQATVQQHQPGTREKCRHPESIRAVGVEQERLGTITLETFLVDDRKRDLDAVSRGHPLPFRDVLRGIVTSRNFLPLQECRFAGLRVVIEDAPRCAQAFIAVAIGC